MIRFRDGVRVLANPEFGASQHIAHIVLTVLKHDSSHRSAMNIKYSEKSSMSAGESVLPLRVLTGLMNRLKTRIKMVSPWNGASTVCSFAPG